MYLKKFVLVASSLFVMGWAAGEVAADEYLPRPVTFVLKVGSEPQWTTDEASRGYVVCTDHWQRPMYDVFVPTRTHIPQSLSLIAARDEYESIQLGVYTLKNLENVTLEVELDLPVTAYRFVPIDWKNQVARFQNGQVVQKEEVVKMPYFLYHDPTYRQAEAGKTYGYWLTVQVPKDALPGEHTGTVRITASDGAETVLPLTVNVRSFVLPKPKITFGLYYDPDTRINEAYRGAEYQRMYYADMAAHGMNSVSIYDDTHALLNADGTWNEEPFAEKFRLMKEAGLLDREQPVFILTGYWSNLSNAGQIEAIEACIAQLEALRAKYDLPEILMYGHDEPGGPFEPKIEMMKPWIDAGMKFITAMHSPDAIQALSPYYSVTLVNDRFLSKEEAELTTSSSSEFWTYDCDMHGFTPIYSRTYSGIWSWNAGVKGNFVWAYTHSHWGDRDYYSLDENGEVVLHLLRYYARAAPGPKGPLPAIGWEARREGVDDYRYLQLVDELASCPDADPAVVAEVRAWFAMLDKEIPWEEISKRLKYYAPSNGDFDAYDHMDAYRRSFKIKDYDALREQASDFVERLER